MKKISIVIPCFNEVENVELISFAVENVLEEALSEYDYEILPSSILQFTRCVRHLVTVLSACAVIFRIR